MRSCSPEALRSPVSWPGLVQSGPPAHLRSKETHAQMSHPERPPRPSEQQKCPARKSRDEQGEVWTLRAGACSGQCSGSQFPSRCLCSIRYAWGQGNSSANPVEKCILAVCETHPPKPRRWHRPLLSRPGSPEPHSGVLTGGPGRPCPLGSRSNQKAHRPSSREGNAGNTDTTQPIRSLKETDSKAKATTS